MKSKLAGGVLLIVGTCIGGGMLALPVATAAGGFIPSLFLLFMCWAVMTFSAFLILEVNLWLPHRSNMISMARKTLGRPGEVVAWASYILLLYSLLAAYISGGSAIFHDLLTWIGWVSSPEWISSVLFVMVFGYIVHRGIQPVDYVNRALMTVKLGSLIILVLFALPYLHLKNLTDSHPLLLTSAVTVVLTSFGFSNIVPSLRSYFDDDVKKLRRVILIGSLIPLFFYIVWEFAILGTLPSAGENGLSEIARHGGSATDLAKSLSFYLQNASITTFAHVFTVICVLTAFLGVSLGLSDFLADGLRLEKSGKRNLLITVVTFLPPLAVVIFDPTIFVTALSYAGTFAVILLVLLPALMAWSGRYRKCFAGRVYEAPGGKAAISVLIVVALAIIVLGVAQMG